MDCQFEDLINTDLTGTHLGSDSDLAYENLDDAKYVCTTFPASICGGIIFSQDTNEYIPVFASDAVTPSPSGATSYRRTDCQEEVPRTIKIHGRTHITGIELSPWRDTNDFFGSNEDICSTCIINLDSNENVKFIRYRSGIYEPLNGLSQSDLINW